MKIIGFYSDQQKFPWEMLHISSHHVQAIDEGDGYWFVIYNRDPNLRQILEKDPLATILPSPNNPNPIKKEHLIVLAKHGVIETDSHWQAHEKISKSLGHPLFHPDH